jgi:hypothetical protein
MFKAATLEGMSSLGSYIMAIGHWVLVRLTSHEYGQEALDLGKIDAIEIVDKHSRSKGNFTKG